MFTTVAQIAFAACVALIIDEAVRIHREETNRKHKNDDRFKRQREEALRQFRLVDDDLAAIQAGHTLARPQEGRRIWVTGYTGNYRIHWSHDGKEFDQAVPPDFNFSVWARARLGLGSSRPQSLQQ